MCILLKLHYAKFDVSSLFRSKVIDEKPLGVWLDPQPPLGKGRVKRSKNIFDDPDRENVLLEVCCW